MIEQYDVQILMKIGLRDLKQITKFPEETALEFFQLLEIEDFTNFTKERTQELKQNPTSLLLQDINPRFFDPSTEALIKSKMLFDDSKPSFTPARIYGLVLPIYPVGSQKSIKFLQTLLKFGFSEVFATKSIKILFNYRM